MDRFCQVRARRAVRWLLAAISISLAAEAPEGSYGALKNALGLSDVQISKCLQGASVADQVLDASQRSKLRAILERATRSDAEGALANWLGLNERVKWGLCACERRIKLQASELGFSDTQLAKLSELESAAKPALLARHEGMKKRWLELLNLADGKGSPEANRLSEAMSALLNEMEEPRLPRDVAFGLLNDKQRVLAADLENTLLLIGEAIDLKLLPRHYQVERGLCH